jgi:rSAM/selenodomain-associated transferase 1
MAPKFMNKDLLIIFVRNPILGKVKTRLAATVGPEKALAVYRELLDRTRAVTINLNCDKALFYDGYIPAVDNWDSSVFAKHIQTGNILGERMQQAFQTGFANQYNRICIIGSDCYELTTKIIQQAFRALEKNEVVIGPSADGGYYLLGMTKPLPFLFIDKSWSTDSVLRQTLLDIKERGLSVALLPTLTDVDEEKDLPTMRVS